MLGRSVDVLLIAMLFTTGAALAIPLRNREIRTQWRAVADRMGLTFEPGRLLGGDGMTGAFGPHPVRIDHILRKGTRIAVGLELPEGVRIAPRHLWFYEGGERGEDHLEGLAPVLLPMLRQLGLSRLYILTLDAVGEARLDGSIYSAHVGIENGELYLTSPERIQDPETLALTLGGLARLADGLADPELLASALSENARSPAAPERRRGICLQLLLEHFPSSTECGRAAWAITQAPHLADNPQSLRLALLALRHLGAMDDLREAIDGGLASAAPLARAVAVEATIGLPLEQALPRLLSAARDPSPLCAVTAIRLLGLLGPQCDARVERLLLDLVRRGAPCLRVDVVCSLATAGGAEAIGALMELELVADPAVRKLCRHALNRLQKRFPERQSGSLSLVGGGGELSEP